jgi:predicted HTH transcriptional regulator
MTTESNRIEYKRMLTDKFEKEIVAFLNYHEGGIIYIGIDKNGAIVGVENADQCQLKIVYSIKNNILPNALGLFDVVLETIENKPIIKIIVSSGTEKPYYIKGYGMSPNGCYLCVGSSAQPMTTAMIDEMYAKRVRKITLGNIPSPRTDLTFEQLKIYYEEKGLKLGGNFKRNLDLLLPDGGYNYIAYLLSDSNGTSIKVAKYAGKDKVDLVENDEYGYCSLIKATNRVLDKLAIENKTFVKITPKARLEKNMVDRVALREAVINAIVHNDYTREVPPVFEIYADRITITSYGGLVEGLAKDDFLSCLSMPRNRELMRVFRDVDLVEQLGSGMSRILKAYDERVFECKRNFLIITFPFEVGYYEEHHTVQEIGKKANDNERE